VFLWGAARSGTNAITNHLKLSPDVTSFNEDNPAAFDSFCLRPDVVIEDLVRAAKTRVVYFKAFNDTLRADLAMARFPGSKGIYAIRKPQDCIASFMREFGEFGRLNWIDALSQSANGEFDMLSVARATGALRQRAVARISERSLALLSAYGPSLPNVAAAYYLFQHSFFSEMKLEYNKNIRVLDYDALIQDPEDIISRLCNWLRIRFVPAMADDWWQGRGLEGIDLMPHPELVRHCDVLYREIAGSEQCLSGAAVPQGGSFCSDEPAIDIRRPASPNRGVIRPATIGNLVGVSHFLAPQPAAKDFTASASRSEDGTPSDLAGSQSEVLDLSAPQTPLPEHRKTQHRGLAARYAVFGVGRLGLGKTTWTRPPPALVSATIVVAAVTLAVLVTETLQSMEGSRPALYTFYAVIASSGWLGGSQAGWISIAFSTLASTYFFIPPIHSLRIEIGELPGFFEFLLCAVFVLLFTLRVVRRRSPSGKRASRPLRQASRQPR